MIRLKKKKRSQKWNTKSNIPQKSRNVENTIFLTNKKTKQFMVFTV